MVEMKYKSRTGCPCAYFLELLGDKWSLLILRDVIILGKQHYHEFLESAEGISTNILADRLAKLEKLKILKKTRDPNNLRKNIYSPTEKALDLLPMFIEMFIWASKYDLYTAVTREHLDRFRGDRSSYIADVRAKFNSTTTR